LADQSVKGRLDVGVEQPGARHGDEQSRRTRRPTRPVVAAQIRLEGGDGARMQRHLTGLAELAVADRQQTIDRIEVAAIGLMASPTRIPLTANRAINVRYVATR